VLLKRRIKYKIIIEASANNGFLVTVGCANLVYTTVEELLRDLKQYLIDPEMIEKEYVEMNFPSVILNPNSGLYYAAGTVSPASTLHITTEGNIGTGP